MKVTVIVIIVSIAALICYDIYALVQFGVDATISAITLRAAMRHPIISFAAGVLCGHLFWSQAQGDDKGDKSKSG